MVWPVIFLVVVAFLLYNVAWLVLPHWVATVVLAALLVMLIRKEVRVWRVRRRTRHQSLRRRAADELRMPSRAWPTQDD